MGMRMTGSIKLLSPRYAEINWVLCLSHALDIYFWDIAVIAELTYEVVVVVCLHPSDKNAF